MLEKLLDKVGMVKAQCSSYEAVDYTDESVGYIVKLLRKDSNDYYLVEVWIDSAYKDVRTDWHQYIFSLDNDDDLARKAVQENNDEFDCATSEAICYLEKVGVIYQDEEGYWYDK